MLGKKFYQDSVKYDPNDPATILAFIEQEHYAKLSKALKNGDEFIVARKNLIKWLAFDTEAIRSILKDAKTINPNTKEKIQYINQLENFLHHQQSLQRCAEQYAVNEPLLEDINKARQDFLSYRCNLLKIEFHTDEGMRKFFDNQSMSIEKAPNSFKTSPFRLITTMKKEKSVELVKQF